MQKTESPSMSRILAKFDPKPKTESAEPQPESAKANVQDGGPPGILKDAPQAAKGKDYGQEMEGNFLLLGGGYKIRVKAGSGYCVLLSIMSQRGAFEECASILGSGFNPLDCGQAQALLSKMMVPMNEVISLVENDASWKEHQRRKTQQVAKRAASGHEASRKLIDKDERFKEGKWRGNIREIIGVCRESYHKENKNVEKFVEAKVVFRLYPLDPKRSEEPFAMLFPKEYVPKVKAAIKTVYGVDEDATEKKKG